MLGLKKKKKKSQLNSIIFGEGSTCQASSSLEGCFSQPQPAASQQVWGHNICFFAVSLSFYKILGLLVLNVSLPAKFPHSGAGCWDCGVLEEPGLSCRLVSQPCLAAGSHGEGDTIFREGFG